MFFFLLQNGKQAIYKIANVTVKLIAKLYFFMWVGIQQTHKIFNVNVK